MLVSSLSNDKRVWDKFDSPWVYHTIRGRLLDLYRQDREMAVFIDRNYAHHIGLMTYAIGAVLATGRDTFALALFRRYLEHSELAYDPGLRTCLLFVSTTAEGMRTWCPCFFKYICALRHRLYFAPTPTLLGQ